MADIYETTSELADLWPALATALARDTADMSGAHTWTAATIVNTDVLAAMITLDREIPLAYRSACETTGEPWQPRPLDVTLRALPRLASRLDNTGHVGHAKRLTIQAAAWLRLTKRALGLRKPDIPLTYACPYADDLPERHEQTRRLFMAGAEGFLRPSPDGGLLVTEVAYETIYCSSPDCDASWAGEHEWLLLGRMLRVPSLEVA
jgi:hypothetical protein